MANLDYSILARHLGEFGGEFHERVHVPMTLDTVKVAFDYCRGQADMQGHTAELHAIHMEEPDLVLLSLTSFRKIGKRGREVGKPLKLGAVSIKNEAPMPEPAVRVDGYLMSVPERGPISMAGLVAPDTIVKLEGFEPEYGVVAVSGFTDAICSHYAKRIKAGL